MVGWGCLGLERILLSDLCFVKIVSMFIFRHVLEIISLRHLFPPFSITSSVISSVTSFPEEGEARRTLHHSRMLLESCETSLMKLVSRESFSKLKEWSDNIAERTFQETKERHRVKFQSLLNRNIEVNRFTPIDPEKGIINLSKRELTPQQRQVLTLGLNFIPTPRHIPQVDIIAGTESLARYLPGHQGEQLRSEVQRCLSKAGVPSPNLTKRQTAAIKELKVDSDTIILPANKGNATVLLDKEEYDHRERELLDDTSYQPIKKNPTLKIERKVTEVLRSLERNGKLPNDLRKRVQNQQSSTPSYMDSQRSIRPVAP